MSSLIFAEVLALIDEVNKVDECFDAFLGVQIGIMETFGFVHGGGLLYLNEGRFLPVIISVLGDVLLSCLVPILNQTHVIIHSN